MADTLGILQVIILGLSAFAALMLYFATWRGSRKRNSFDHIARQTRDHDLIKMFEEFRALRAQIRAADKSVNYETIKSLKVPIENGEYEARAENILKKVFNYYEATAIGISRGALDEQMIKEWWRTTFVLDWKDFKQFVKEAREREDVSKLYCEYETLVTRWAINHERELIK